MARSAMSEQQKNSILANELIRRLSNVSEEMPKSEEVNITNLFTKQLKNSGYTHKQARAVVAWYTADKKR